MSELTIGIFKSAPYAHFHLPASCCAQKVFNIFAKAYV